MDKSTLRTIFASMTGKKVAVIGDLMLDSYIWGKVTRISPEAPVPVVHVRRKTFCLGGAANVMKNIVSMGGEAIAFGILGVQATGNQLLELIKECRIIYSAGQRLFNYRKTENYSRIPAVGES